MPTHRKQLGGILNPGRAWRRRWLLASITLGFAVPWIEAAPPLFGESSVSKLDTQLLRTAGPAPERSRAPEPMSATPRVASTSSRPLDTSRTSTPATERSAAAGDSAFDSIAMAKRLIAACQDRFRHVHDYTCTFVKRERIDGRLTAPHVMDMKSRTHPLSIYFKFHQPNRGREAIYIHGRNNGRIVAHDVGWGKFLAGTMYLDPRGSMAMEENRHPVTEAGLGSLIDTIARHWSVELTPGESVVSIHPEDRIESRSCTLIESVHPQHGSNFLFHKVKLYVDNQLGLPIRFEAYDWPRHSGAAPDLVEEYTYRDLKLNIGLHEHDFDPANKQYSYGRF